MPEDIVPDDEVISQDDIDKLLNASVHDEDNNGNETDADPAPPADDTLAELSQDDIDNLLSGGPLGSDLLTEESDDNDDSNTELNKDSEAEDTDELDLISQNDIDSLLDGIQKTQEPVSFGTAPDTETDDDDDDDDLELVSQEDISKLLNENVPQSFENIAPLTNSDSIEQDAETDIDAETEPSTDEEDTDILELVSQDDIDKLMNQGPEDDDGEGQEVDLQEATGTRYKEELLDESDALDIEDCLITQTTIDQLMNENIEDADRISDTAADGEPESVRDDLDKNFKEQNDFETQIAPEIKPDEIKPYGEDDLTEKEDFTESDINKILKDPPDTTDGENEDNSNLISQEDIDALLQGSEEEDEDILGDIDETSGSPGSNDHGSENSQGQDIDEQDNQVVIEDEETEEPGNVDPTDSIHLVDEISTEESGKNDQLKKKWYKSKLLLAGLGIFVLFASIGSGYYFFFYGPAIKAKLHNKSVKGRLNAENVNANISAFPQIIVPHGPGAIIMKDFIVLSPIKNKKLIYLNADISVHYSQGQALEEIKKHLPFYRGIIYDAIDKALQPGQKQEISEKKLSEVIKKALNQVMTKNYIDRVLFISFKIG